MMHARDYSPHLGRFLSMDPIGGALSQPQSSNRYAYVLGDPLSFTDPWGLTPEHIFYGAITVFAYGQIEDTLDRLQKAGVWWQQVNGQAASMPQDYGLLDVARARDFYQTRFEQAAVEGRWLSALAYFAINELVLPESQDELGTELAMAVVPVGKLGKLGRIVQRGTRHTPDHVH